MICEMCIAFLLMIAYLPIVHGHTCACIACAQAFILKTFQVLIHIILTAACLAGVLQVDVDEAEIRNPLRKPDFVLDRE